MSESKSTLYTVYFTGAAGNSIGLFFIGKGFIEGVDVGGLKYSGNYSQDPKTGNLAGIVNFVVPPNASLITGMTAGADSMTIPVQINLPADFENGSTIRIDTPTGPVNAIFEKVRDLP